MQKTFGILLLALVLIVSGCSVNNKLKGTTVGAAGGGVIGGVIGSKAGNSTAGVLIGAAIGGTAGYFIGRYMDKQAAKIEEEVENVEVERIGEGIKLTFDSGLLFDYNSAKINATTENNLRELADILQEYPETEILLQGHTDNTGSEDYNLELSEKRAKSVRNFLAQQNVNSRRFVIEGYGESMPVADNDTNTGRQKNRRVEVAIYADEDLKQKAQNGELENKLSERK
ncbi:MAG: OmpA family protein [Bacteroidota bacterium]